MEINAAVVPECKGRKRGWTERHELTGAKGGPVQFDYASSAAGISDDIARKYAKRAAAVKGTSKNGKRGTASTAYGQQPCPRRLIGNQFMGASAPLKERSTASEAGV